MSVRFLKSDDFLDWQALWQGYLDFYNVELADQVTRDVWRRLHERSDPLFGFVYEDEKGVFGFTHFFKHGTTWHPVGYCYLEDLYVSEKARNSGAGRALIMAVKDWAVKEGCAKLYWHTNHDNETAQKLYNKLAKDSGFIRYDISLGKIDTV